MRTLLLLLLLLSTACTRESSPKHSDLYQGFRNPPAEARPFVRWWWNGNKIEEAEVTRELQLLKEAGFGGVEINPIAFPPGARETGAESKVWMSEEWIEQLVHACSEAGDLGLIADLIVGSGWPFGGEFLEGDEIIQMVIPHQYTIEGARKYVVTTGDLMERLKTDLSTGRGHLTFNERYPPQLLYASLMASPLDGRERLIDLSGNLMELGSAELYLDPSKTYVLSYGVIQKGHRTVMHGAPGAAGPVMDHYKKEVTLAYLSRLREVARQSGIPLSQLIRALFCDSIELAGSNWTDGLSDLFFESYGYKLKPYMPFVFSHSSGYMEYPEMSPEFQDSVYRARYDFTRLLVDVFLKNFTQVFQDFCTSEELLCRYQAYGVPFLMGMLEGFMIPDIPESNNWIYSAEMDSPSWEWNLFHGYMVWNMFAASGGHLKGRKIISCEAMTNTRGVFKTSLEEIKQHDDMNFITGINHSVLHGFNYSPPEAGFPGWIRYGAYFSEQNPWWPYLNKWVDYNARLSYIFQNSKPQKSIAILGPTADHWSEVGLIRQPFHAEPWYLHHLWQPISQAGYSAEYLNEKVIQEAEMGFGLIEYGPMEYKALILANVRSMAPETAQKIQEFVESGGSLLIIDQMPERSVQMAMAEENDRTIRQIFEALCLDYPTHVTMAVSPVNQDLLNVWIYELLSEMSLQPDVVIEEPDPDVYQIYQKAGYQSIYFFTNVHRSESAWVKASFPHVGGRPYFWDPETGERWKYPYDIDDSELQIHLPPLKSVLLVFDKKLRRIDPYEARGNLTQIAELTPEWKVEGEHVNGQHFQWELTELSDFALSTDPDQNSFAGKLIYSTTFENQGNIGHLHLGETHRGITRVRINGKDAGTNWYGDAVFPISPYLQAGENLLEITYTTVLANYCLDLDDPVALNWTKYGEKVPCGMEGPILLMN
jgi:hypothetical protein